MLASHKHILDNSTAPNVDGLEVLFAERHFRGHKDQGAAIGMSSLEAFGSEAKPEVNNFNEESLWVYNNVF